jgi:hypothetical protein
MYRMVPSFKGGHELRSQREVGGDADRDEEQGRDDHPLRMFEDESAGRFIDPEEAAADGMPLLCVIGPDQGGGSDSGQPARPKAERLHSHEEHPHGRIEGDSEDRRDGHGQVLRPG